MTSDNDKKLVLLNRVSRDGGSCPDGATCPAEYATNWGTHITVGQPVTDPEVLEMLHLAADEIATETPASLHDEP